VTIPVLHLPAPNFHQGAPSLPAYVKAYAESIVNERQRYPSIRLVSILHGRGLRTACFHNGTNATQS